MGSPQEEACPVAACQGGRTVGDRPAGADLPERRMAGGACPEAAPTQPEDHLQDTASNLILLAETLCYDDIPPHAPWHCRPFSCMRGAANDAGKAQAERLALRCRMHTCGRSGSWSGAHDWGCRDLRPRQHHARRWPAHAPCRRTQALRQRTCLLSGLPLIRQTVCQST